MSSWGHVAWRLTDAEIDHDDRWGMRCRTGKCTGAAEYATQYRYTTGRRGNTSTSTRHACGKHAKAFAAKNHIEVTESRPESPARRGVIAAAAAAWTDLPESVRVERYGRSGWCLTMRGGGALISGTGWLTLPHHTPYEAVLTAAEAELARRFSVVVTGPWHLDAVRGTTQAPTAQASAVDAWAGKPWQVTVAEDDHGVWEAHMVLDPRFRADAWPLGNTGMNLDRAIRTVPVVLPPAWTLGEWTRHGNRATTTATFTREKNAA